MWERNRDYQRGKRCLVCNQPTNSLAAPLGIVSGSFPVCQDHSDREVVKAYLEWAQRRLPGIDPALP